MFSITCRRKTFTSISDNFHQADGQSRVLALHNSRIHSNQCPAVVPSRLQNGGSEWTACSGSWGALTIKSEEVVPRDWLLLQRPAGVWCQAPPLCYCMPVTLATLLSISKLQLFPAEIHVLWGFKMTHGELVSKMLAAQTFFCSQTLDDSKEPVTCLSPIVSKTTDS